MSLTSLIQQKILARNVDTEFIWAWGEFQKTVATLYDANADLEVHERLRQNGIAKRKDRARQWYALWHEWYQESSEMPKTRVGFNVYFENFLTALKNGKRRTLRDIDLQDLLFLIRELSSPKHKNEVRLPKSFTTDGISKDKLSAYLIDAKKTERPLPPVGEKSYPIR